jgi:hypothetical protein
MEKLYNSLSCCICIPPFFGGARHDGSDDSTNEQKGEEEMELGGWEREREIVRFLIGLDEEILVGKTKKKTKIWFR